MTGACAALESCDSSTQLQVLRLEGRFATRSRLSGVDVPPWQVARLSVEGQQHAQQEKNKKQQTACTVKLLVEPCEEGRHPSQAVMQGLSRPSDQNRRQSRPVTVVSLRPSVSPGKVGGKEVEEGRSPLQSFETLSDSVTRWER